MRPMKASLWISLACFAAAGTAAPAQRALTAKDYYAIKTPDSPRLSPDGKFVAYTVITIDRAHDRKKHDIWLVPLDGSSAARQFTTDGNSSAPQWRPDGRALAFLSARTDPETAKMGKPQVYELPMDGGEARRLTNLKNGVSAFQWSPDGNELACVSKIGPSDSAPAGTVLSDELDYLYPEDKFDGVGFFTDQREHIWVVDIAGGVSRQITFGDQQNDTNPQWSPDGTRIAYVGNRTDSKIYAGEDSSIFIVSAKGGKPFKLPVSTMGMGTAVWSPNGDELAYVGSADATFVPKIWTAPAAGGPAVLVSNDVTYPSNLSWAANGRSLYYLAPDKGYVSIYSINRETHKIRPLSGADTVRQMDVNAAARSIAYIASDDTHPPALFSESSDGKGAHRLTHLNDELLSKVEVQPSAALNFTSVDGWKIEGFFTKPLDWQPGKKYPMILMIHGGPNGMWGPNWDLTAQCFAAHGWAVLRINPRGSSGYGEAFQRGVYKQFGGKAYQDLMNGVDAALKEYPWVDPSRLGVTGHSYGGFMTNWIIGHTTRFKAAVAQSGMTDFISDDSARDAFYGHARDFGVQFWDDPDVFWKNSPLLYAKNVKTPTLFLQGMVDMRVPEEQAEEYFRALNHFGIPTELVLFPGESHDPGKTPRHVDDWMKWQIYWFERWIDGNTHAIKPNAIP